MLRKSGIPLILITVLFPGTAFAVDWTYTPLGGEATELTGGYGAVANPADGSVYNDGGGDYSYPVILDSGSSGFLMSETVTSFFGVPLQSGQTYTETGIGGSETENVTQPLVAYYSPASNMNPDNISTMTAYGTYTFESRQSDPAEGFIFFDVVGTPVMQSRVMAVTPSQSYDVVQGTLGFLTAQTTLQSSAPVLPSKGLYHVPVTWTNFVSGPTVPTEGLNAVVKGVTASGPSHTPVANDWLFDSGAQFTIISPAYASQLGIDLNDPISTVQGQGVGGATVNFDEFQITSIVLPLSNGDHLVFSDPYVFVPEGTVLPAGLTGILGENLFMQSTDMIDPYSGEPEGTYAPLFAQWYLDGPGSQLVLYDPNSIYSAAGPAWTGTTNNNWTTQAADSNWSGGGSWSNNADRTNPNTATFDLANPATIMVNSNIDVGSITFTTGGWTLGAGSGVLAFGATGAITITTTTGTDFINATIADGSTFGTGGGVTSLIKSGDGTLILAGFNSYTGSTTVSAGTLLIAAAGALPDGGEVANAGTLLINNNSTAGIVTGSGSTIVAANTTLMAKSIAQGSLTVNGKVGIVAEPLAPGPGNINPLATTSVVGSLTLAGGTTPTGTLDLSDNMLVIANGGAAGRDMAAADVSYARNGGLWNRPGITSSSAATVFAGAHFDAQTLGVALNSDLPTPFATFGGQPVSANDVLIRFTYGGDANLDGVINGNDYFQIDRGFLNHDTGWVNGDFNFDGMVNGNDYFIVDSNFINQSGMLAAPEVLAHAAEFGPAYLSQFSASQLTAIGVPEPGSLALLGLGAMGLVRRRGRKDD